MVEEKHQDYIYINEDYYKDPKETFSFISKLINDSHHIPSVLDLGCARGEFLYFLKNCGKAFWLLQYHCSKCPMNNNIKH